LTLNRRASPAIRKQNPAYRRVEEE